MFVDGGGEGEEDHDYRVDDDGGDDADVLDEQACKCEAEGLATEGDEAENAVDAALEFVGDQCAAVAELDDVVDRAGDEEGRGEYAQHNGIGGDDIEWHDKGRGPGGADDGLAKAEAFLN